MRKFGIFIATNVDKALTVVPNSRVP